MKNFILLIFTLLISYASAAQEGIIKDAGGLDPGDPYTQFTFAFEHLEEAKKFARQRDEQIQSALKLFKEAAEQGYLNAQLTLAYIHLLGDAVPVNHKEAHHWYLMAAEQHNSPEAQATIAAMYFDGLGVTRSDEAGLYWAMKAALQRNPLGQLLAARAYHYGKGVYPDLHRAKKLYRQACEAGRQEACNTLEQLTQAEK